MTLLLPVLTAFDTPTYQAQSIVVGQQLLLESSALPRFGEAVFHGDSMASSLSAAVGAPVGAPSLIPARVDLVTAEDSILFVVLGRSANPEDAARLADTGASTFVAELNRAGSGVGAFAVLSLANVPTQLTGEGPPVLLMGALGAAAGAVLALGLIALIAAVRRPMLQSADVERALGVPVLGTVLVPSTSVNRLPDPHEVVGISAVARALMDAPYRTVVLASAPPAVAIRQRLLVLLARTLSPLRHVVVHGPAQLSDAVQVGLDMNVPIGLAATSQPDFRDELDLVDGDVPLDLLAAPPRAMAVLLVVQHGAAAWQIRRMAEDHLTSEIFGAVIVEQRGVLRRLVIPSSAPHRTELPVSAAPVPMTTQEDPTPQPADPLPAAVRPPW